MVCWCLTPHRLRDQEQLVTVVTASDGTNSTDQSIAITITDIDDTAPVFTSSSSFTAEENQLSIGIVIATDVDSNSITYSLSGADASALEYWSE